jgi:hypothetical protein
MTWHEHLDKLPSKGSITIASGSTSVMTTVNGFIGDFQPLVSFAIAAIAGIITICVGWLAIREKKAKIRQEQELHDLVMQKQSIEILTLKKNYEKHD